MSSILTIAQYVRTRSWHCEFFFSWTWLNAVNNPGRFNAKSRLRGRMDNVSTELKISSALLFGDPVLEEGHEAEMSNSGRHHSALPKETTHSECGQMAPESNSSLKCAWIVAHWYISFTTVFRTSPTPTQSHTFSPIPCRLLYFMICL